MSGDPARAGVEFPAEVGGSKDRLTAKRRRPGMVGGRLIAAVVSAVMVGLLTVSISGVFAAGGGHLSQPASKTGHGGGGGGGGHASNPGHGGHASKPGHGGGGGGHRSPPGHGGHASKTGHG